MREDHAIADQVARLVEGGELAAGAEGRVDGEDAAVLERGGEELAAQVAGEDDDGVILRPLRQFAADLALEARHEQPVQRVVGAFLDERAVRVVLEVFEPTHERHLPARPASALLRRRALRVLAFGGGSLDRRFARQGQTLQGDAPADLAVPLQLRRQGAVLLAAVDGEDAVRRDLANRLGELEVVFVLQPLALRELVALARRQPTRVPENQPEDRTHVGRLGDHLGDDVPGAGEDVLDRVELLLGVDERGQHLVEVGDDLVGLPDLHRQRLQAALAGRRRQALLLRLVGQVEVFEALGVVGVDDGRAQLVGELALPLDGAQDGLLALGHVAQSGDALLDRAQHLLVQPAGPLFAVAGDERDGVALVEELDDGLDLDLADLQVLRDPREVHVAEVAARRGRLLLYALRHRRS